MRWKPVVGFELEYHVSENGDIKSLARLRSDGRPIREKILKQTRWKCGYGQVALCKNGQRPQNKLVHRIVAEAFLPAGKADQTQVAHNDGDGSNNHYLNLRWATPVENAADKAQHGTHNKGTKHPSHKLDDDAVRDIRSAKAAGEHYKSIAARHGINPNAVYPIVRGEAWSHVNQ